jgi:glutathione S-transferase
LKLLTVSASPYGRKVRVVISELAIIEKIEIINDNPWLKETLVSKANPIGKVPVLILDDNNSLYDSKLICEYLDNQSKKILLYPEAGKERWDVLRLQNLADQMMDAFILRRLESKRPEGKQHEPWINRQWSVIQRSLNQADKDIISFRNDINIGTIALGVALAHLDFRRDDDEDWRIGRTNLKEFFEILKQRPSMQSTEPHD